MGYREDRALPGEVGTGSPSGSAKQRALPGEVGTGSPSGSVKHRTLLDIQDRSCRLAGSGGFDTDGARQQAVAWMESHARVMQFWLDRLVDTGDPDGLVDTLHRQCAWLDLMLDRHRGQAR